MGDPVRKTSTGGSRRCALPARLVAFTMAIAMGSGCATRSWQPTLYPSAKVASTGSEVLQGEIDACIGLAETHGVGAEGVHPIAGEAAAATVEEMITAAFSALNPVNLVLGLGRRLAGLAARGALGGSQAPTPEFQHFVGRCMAERGYEVVSWRKVRATPRTEPVPPPTPPAVVAATVPAPAPEAIPRPPSEVPSSGTPLELEPPPPASSTPPSGEEASLELALRARSEALTAWRSLEQSSASGVDIDVSDRAGVWLLLAESDEHFAEGRLEEARRAWQDAIQQAEEVLERSGSRRSP